MTKKTDAEVVAQPASCGDIIAAVAAESSLHSSRLQLVNSIADRIEKLPPSQEELNKFAAELRANLQAIIAAECQGKLE